MIAAWTLSTLIRLVPVMWVLAAGLLAWILDDGPPELGAAMAFALVMACTGTILWMLHRGQDKHDTRVAAMLFDALMATPPACATAPVLHLVAPEATAPSTHAVPG